MVCIDSHWFHSLKFRPTSLVLWFLLPIVFLPMCPRMLCQSDCVFDTFDFIDIGFETISFGKVNKPSSKCTYVLSCHQFCLWSYTLRTLIPLKIHIWKIWPILKDRWRFRWSLEHFCSVLKRLLITEVEYHFPYTYYIGEPITCLHWNAFDFSLKDERYSIPNKWSVAL